MKFNGRNIFISDKAKIGARVKIGDNVIIYDNVFVGDDSIICNDVVIGEPIVDYYYNSNYQNPPVNIGANSLIRSHSIIYAGCNIGTNFISGHRITVRENTVIGKHCSIGTLSDIQNNVEIGNYCRLHSSVTIGTDCRIGNFVFMYPFSVMTNDPAPPSEEIQGGYVGDYSQICTHAIVLPGITIGEHCLIGANSVVSKRISDYSLATGNPAKVLIDIRKYVVMGIGKPYPWMKRFSRGMPWAEMGYDNWVKTNQKQ